MYLLDSNIFITAKNRHYGFDFVPAFWDWLDSGHTAGVLCSTSKVRQELLAGQDELTQWATGRAPLFLSPDAAIVPSLKQLTQWATSASFTPAASRCEERAARRYPDRGRGLPRMEVLTQPSRKTSTCLTLPSRPLT